MVRNLKLLKILFSLHRVVPGVLIFFSACGRHSPEQPKEEILAKIGDKTISVNEFIRRAEYSPRPPYCNGDDYIQRKIVLNSLIAEKLLACEAGDQNDLTNNQEFQNYLRGREEQALRQWLYNHDFYEKAQPDTNAVKKTYDLVGRRYKITYYTIKDSAIARQVQQKLQQGESFEQVFREFGGLVAIPQREVDWQAEEQPAIHDALFSAPLVKNQVLGPVQTDKNFYTVMQVQGWTDRLAISDTDMRQRWNDVYERLKTAQAEQAFGKMVAQLMKGKKLEFERDTFFKLIKILGDFYLQTTDEKKRTFNQRFWQQDSSELTFADVSNDLEKLRSEPLLHLDGKVWTVQELENEVSIHPLLFRKKRIQRHEFGEQLKLAIADLIRDRFISQEAARRGYDRVNVVARNVAMWRDSYLALYQCSRFLAANGKLAEYNRDRLNIIHSVLNPYIDSLQHKYNAQIEINTDQFEKINLTRIDMMVLQVNAPYPILMPAFPLLTTDNQLNYGKKMK